MKKYFIYSIFISLSIILNLPSLQAQVINKVVKSAVGHFSSLDLEGTWRYEEAVVEFQSDNLLKKAGGKVAASSVEKNLNEQLNKVGFQPGVTTFTFNSDSTFTNITNDKKLSGKYTYDNDTKYITLKYLNHLPIKAKVSGSGEKISLLFEASAFLSMVTFVGSHSGVSVISSLSSILNSYDGMMAGIELKKQ